MSLGAALGSTSPPDAGATHDRNRSRWQVRIRTLILVMAAIAVWIAFVINRRQNALLRERIHQMRLIAHDLVINDDNRIAVVSLDELWYDQDDWDIYLPHREYRLCIATRGITRDGRNPSKYEFRPIKPGRHRISLKKITNGQSWDVMVLTDGSEFLTVNEPGDWGVARGSSGFGDQFSVSEQLSPDQPVCLFRRQFWDGPPSSSSGSSDGIQLWLEPVSLE
jgi:hypothetical protein